MSIHHAGDRLGGVYRFMHWLTIGALWLSMFLGLLFPVPVAVDLGADGAVILLTIATFVISLVRLGAAHGDYVAQHREIKWIPVLWFFMIGVTVFILVLSLSNHGII